MILGDLFSLGMNTAYLSAIYHTALKIKKPLLCLDVGRIINILSIQQVNASLGHVSNYSFTLLFCKNYNTVYFQLPVNNAAL